MASTPSPACICLLLCILLAAFVVPSRAQEFGRQRMGYVAYNVGFNAVVGGVGAVINKKPGQTRGNAFLKGFGKGAMGGLLIHQAKASTYQVYQHERYGYVWPARLLNSLGSSMVQNASANRGLLDRLHLTMWLVRADIDLREKQLLVRAVPTAVIAAVYFTKFGDFNLKRSLQTGLLYYDMAAEFRNSGKYGRSFSTAIAVGLPDNGTYTGTKMYHEVIAHEVVHNLQYESAVWLNAYAQPADRTLKERYSWYKGLSRYVYLDANYLAQRPMNLLGTRKNCHLSSWSEKEAHHYATRDYISCDEDPYSGIGFLSGNE